MRYRIGDKVVLVDRWDHCVGLYGELEVTGTVYHRDTANLIVKDLDGVVGVAPAKRFTYMKSYNFNQLYNKLNGV